MLNDNQKRAKTANFCIKNASNQYTAPQANNFRDIYINQSPTYYNQIRYEDENKSAYIPVHIIQRQGPPGEFYQEGDNFEKTMQNMKIKQGYFFNEFNTMKQNVEGNKNIIQRSVNTFNNQSPNKLNEKYYFLNNNNNKVEENNSKNERKYLRYKEYGHQSYQGEKYPNKIFRSLPLVHNFNYQSNKERRNNSLKPVAQKICNIIIKGEIKKDRGKKMRSGKKRRNPNFPKNIEIEENFARGATVPDKNINFNISPTKESKSSMNQNEEDNYDDNEENEYEEIEEEKEEIIPNREINSGQRLVYGRNLLHREVDNNEEYEEDDDLRNTEEKRNDVEEVEIEEGEFDDMGEEGQYQMEEGEEEREIEEEQNRIKNRQIRGEQIEQLEDDDEEDEGEDNSGRIIEIKNEEGSHRIHKRDIEELEDDEQQQLPIPDIINKNVRKNQELKLQRGKDIKIEGIEDFNNGIELSKTKMNNNQKEKKNPVILEINSESNVEIIKKEKNSPNEIKKVLNMDQPKNNKKIYKKQILNIIKNKENVDVIREEDQETETNVVSYEPQKIQNFIQPKYKKRKIKSKKEKFNICKIKDNNFILEKIYNDPSIEIENVLIYQQTPEIIKNKKSKFINLKIVKNKDGIFELIGTPSIFICIENEFEIEKKYNKKIYKKSNYKKYKISKRMTHQYNAIQIINDAVIIPKESRFMLKGKPKRLPKKVRNIIKREIQYYYKSPISQKNKELSIGGNIQNSINPNTPSNNDNNLNINNEVKKHSRYYNSNKTTNKERNSISSTTNTNINTNTNNNNKPNLFNVNINVKSNRNAIDKEEDNKKEPKRQKNRTYKTTTVVSSNLLKFDNERNEPVKQEYQSIRRKYTNSKSNKNILIDKKDNDQNNKNNLGTNQPSNELSKDKIGKTESSSNMIRNQKLNFFSPQRKADSKKEENQNENNNFIGRNYIGINKYEHFNKNYLIKSESNNIGKTQSYFSYKNNNNNKTEAPASPKVKENNNNYSSNNYFNGNKSHTITIFSNKQESKNVGRTYISSNKKNQKEQNNDKKIEEKNNSNVGRIYVSTTQKLRSNNNNTQNENKKQNTNINTVYISTNLKKDKVEDKSEVKNDNKETPNNNNVYYSSFSSKKPEQKQIFNNNKMYVSSKGTSSNNNNKAEIKINNLNRILANTSINSPVIVKNFENLDNKLTPNNINKIYNNLSISSNKDNDNKKSSEKVNITNSEESKKLDKNKDKEISKTPREELNSDNKNNESETKNDKNIFNYGTSLTTSNNINNLEDKKDDNKNILDKYNIKGNSQLSDFSKNYLNSFMPFSRPELSDFSKQFLNSNYITHTSNRPELSNLTRVYLNSQTTINENNEK